VRVLKSNEKKESIKRNEKQNTNIQQEITLFLVLVSENATQKEFQKQV